MAATVIVQLRHLADFVQGMPMLQCHRQNPFRKERNAVGRPYIQEMEELTQTREWASRSSIADLTDSIRKIGDRPFFAVGSGGSLTAAAYWAMLHEWMMGPPFKHGTPLDLMALPSAAPYAVGLMSAGGSNPDIVQALTHAASGGSSRQIILTYAQTSPLVNEAQCHGTTDVVSYAPPIPKDGFLATNSLWLP